MNTLPHKAIPSHMLRPHQDAIANAAPRGWTLAIADVSMGADPSRLSDFQAYGDPATGRLAALDCKLALNSDTMKVVVRGTSPIAAFTATVSGIRMSGEARARGRGETLGRRARGSAVLPLSSVLGDGAAFTGSHQVWQLQVLCTGGLLRPAQRRGRTRVGRWGQLCAYAAFDTLCS